MMDLADLRLSDVGRLVVYTARHGSREEGVISSWNERFVFVKYGIGATAVATDPEQLEFYNS